MRRKVLIFTNLFPNPEEPTRGIFTAQIASRMKRLADVVVVSPLPWFPKLPGGRHVPKWHKFAVVPRFAEMDGIPVYYPRYLVVPKVSEPFHALSLFLATFGLVRRLVREGAVDAINAHWVYPDGVAASWIARLLRVPMMITALGCDINRDSREWMKRVQIVPALTSADRVTVVSHPLREKVCRLGVPPSKVTVIPNGIDQERFYPTDRMMARRGLGLPIENGKKLILFVGYLVEVKGVTDLVEAVAILKSRLQGGFVVSLVGDGPLKDRLARRVAELHLEREVTFEGPKPHDEIPRWMAACDVLTLPSVQEGQPNVVLEALACGRPIVATAVGGIPELISEERANGVLCPPRDPKSLAEGFLKALRTTYSPLHIRATVERLTWEASAEGYYREVLALPESRSGRSRTCARFLEW